jgi:hypothetical protein
MRHKISLVKTGSPETPSSPETKIFVWLSSQGSQEEFLPFRIGFELLTKIWEHFFVCVFVLVTSLTKSKSYFPRNLCLLQNEFWIVILKLYALSTECTLWFSLNTVFVWNFFKLNCKKWKSMSFFESRR